MPKEDIFERSGAQDLTEEELKKVEKAVEKHAEEPVEKFREIEDEEEVAPIVPMNPTKIDGWNKLTQDRQMELLEKYKAQKKTFEEWEVKKNKESEWRGEEKKAA